MGPGKNLLRNSAPSRSPPVPEMVWNVAFLPSAVMLFPSPNARSAVSFVKAASPSIVVYSLFRLFALMIVI